ncbi:hypothetical protein NE644_22520, partial [Blautia wexlerae]|nr:hypothetical protein [Blautia wexlerae]
IFFDHPSVRGKCSSVRCETVVQKILSFAFVRNNQDTVQFAAVRINFACLKELRQSAGKELRQKSVSGVIIRNQGML